MIFSSGYRPDDSHWIQYPAVDALGFPHTNNGASTIVPGLHFCGVHFLHNHKSSTLFGVSEDATIIAQSPTHHHTTHRAAKRLSQQERPGCKR